METLFEFFYLVKAELMSIMGLENGRQRKGKARCSFRGGKKRFNETQHLRVLSFCWRSSESLLLTCSDPAMAVHCPQRRQSSALSHCLPTGSSFSLIAFSSAPFSVVVTEGPRPGHRWGRLFILFIVYKLRCPHTGLLQGPPAVSAHGGKPRGKRMCEEKSQHRGSRTLYTALHPTHVILQSADCLPDSRAFSLCPNPSSNTPHWWSDFRMSFARINHTQTLATPVLWLPDSPPVTEWHRKCFDPW